MARQYFIQVKITRKQAVDLLNLIEDELESSPEDASDRVSLQRSAANIEEGLKRLEDRLERLA